MNFKVLLGGDHSMVLNIDFRHLASDFNELREPFINYNNCIVIATYSYLSFVIWPILLVMCFYA